MKIKKSELKKLIKEELEAVIDEQQLDELFPAARKLYRDTFDQTGDLLDRAARNVGQSLRILNNYDAARGVQIEKTRDGAVADLQAISGLRNLLKNLSINEPNLSSIGASLDRPKAGLFNQWQEEYMKNLKAIKDGLDRIQNHPSNIAPEPDIGRADFSERGYKTDRETSQKEGLPDPVSNEHFFELISLLKRAQKMIPKFKQGISKKDIYKTKAKEPDDEQ
tara:strand:- start:40 stop:705 length:666 start_codon:yes stop_codon:yes gene_type:complete